MTALLSIVAAVASLSQAAPVRAPMLGVPGLERRAAELKPLHQWTPVYLRVGGGSFVSVWEPRLKIDLNGSRWNGGVRLSGSVGSDSFSVSADPFGGGWSLWGSGVSLELSLFSGSANLWGQVDGRNVSLNISRTGAGWSIWGQGGVNLSASAFGSDLTVSGAIDEKPFGSKQLAALGAALAVLSPVKTK